MAGMWCSDNPFIVIFHCLFPQLRCKECLGIKTRRNNLVSQNTKISFHLMTCGRKAHAGHDRHLKAHLIA